MTNNKLLGVFCSALLATGTAFAGPLADSPLSLKGSVPPNVLFTPSVEWPTAVVYAYKHAGANDTTPATNYASTTEYLGFWDPNKCYDYDTTNGWFFPTGYAASRICDGTKWSGNFMNWLSATATDIFRYAMTGGNRVQDTATLTVLEVTYHDGQGGRSQFPTHRISGNTTVSGATPLN